MFLVANLNELQNIKKEWKVSQPVSAEFDPTVVRLFLLKGKQVVSNWNIFPRAGAIILNNGMFKFDLGKLRLLMSNYPVH